MHNTDILYLKVKIKSLAAEAKIIRQEQAGVRAKRQSLKSRDRLSPEIASSLNRSAVGLSNHRKLDVRWAARNALVAYGFLRGRKYSQIEPGAKSSPNWREVKRMVDKYGVAKKEHYIQGEGWCETPEYIEQLGRFTTWKES